MEDLKKLFGLKDKLGVNFGKGQLIYFPGAPADVFHVILKGRVQVDQPGQGQQQLGAGDLFGEVELFTNRPRAGSAKALDETTTLAFNQESALILAETTPRFLLTILEKCCERVVRAEHGGAAKTSAPVMEAAPVAEPAAPVAASAAAEVPPAAPILAAAASPAAAAGGAVGPVYDVDYKPSLWKKDVVCPNCKAKFGAWSVRTNNIVMSKRESDFRSVYSGVNPNLYSVWVCPKCQLAAYADDFPGLQPVDIGRIKPRLEEVRGQDAREFDFNYYRDLDLALRSYQLALATYQGKRGAEDKIAGLYHRMAWIERERPDEAEEHKYLQLAKDAYEHAFSTLDSEKQGIVWAYMVAELNLRLGNFADAVRWFSTVSQQPNFKEQPVIQEMTRDRWSEAGELSKAAKVAG